MTNNYIIAGNIVDVVAKRIFKGTLSIADGKIQAVTEEATEESRYIIPGLVDAHIHIESSMLIPSEFARLAMVHGTVASVSDPHEIANVLGIDGLEFMINNGNKVPFKFNFGAPSCVPATSFESSGAEINAIDIKKLLQRDDIKYLSEMMNYPGVLFHDKEVHAKLDAAKEAEKPVDGHAPGLSGDEVRKYIESGITTDHECFTKEEALEKIKYGMKVQIREGSAAKNFDALHTLIEEYPNDIMLCSDDKHPDDLVRGHMNEVIKRAVNLGYDPVQVLRICTYNPIKHYKLDVGLLQKGDPADFVIIDNLIDFNILETWIDGQNVAKLGISLIAPVQEKALNIFKAEKIAVSDLKVKAQSGNIKVIEAFDGQLVTKMLLCKPKIVNGFVVSEPEKDNLKLVVINRYKPSQPAVGFIRGVGIQNGALASTVAHDSHNIIAVGTDDVSLTRAINLIIESKGGICLVNKNQNLLLPLPVAGIMSAESGHKVGVLYEQINEQAKEMGSNLHAPFMTLSFMALLVIPEIKLGDKGLFDGKTFSLTSLFSN
ncbi:MAG: adenine deaminase [Bacteroidales bacterium]|nr:adenine deaminase [Bacteroidales bacterium]MCF8402307.1 adenine deaminase [Bacteroidales bacterium]